MLQAIHDGVKGWLAYIIVGLLIIPFAFVGVYNYFSGGSNPVVAEVAGSEITRGELDQAVQRQQERLRQALGERYDPALFDDDSLRRQALQQLIDRALLLGYADSAGLRATDEALRASLRAEPAFQQDGRFSTERYRSILQRNNLSAEGYEAQLRRDLALRQVQDAVSRAALVTEADVRRFIAVAGQQRQVTWLRVPASAFQEQVEVSPEDVAQYYQANQDQFRLPEAVRLRYLMLDLESVAEDVELTEAKLREHYQATQERYGTPERRQVRHILLAVPDEADAETAAEVREKIQTLEERLRNGADFARLAQERSDDPGSAADGGDLGSVGRDEMVPAFEEVAFNLPVGQVSKPVRSEFGWHLIEVTGIEGGEAKPFEEVRDQVRQELALERARNRYFELGNDMANLAFETPDSLEPAAEALGLEVRATDWIPRSGTADGLGAESAVVRAAFDPEVLEQGLNSRLVELEGNRQVVVRVAEHRPAETQPLEAVREQVRERLVTREASRLATEEAARLAEALRAGGDPGTLADDSPAMIREAGWVRRDGTDLPRPLVPPLFKMPPPPEDGVTTEVVPLPAGDSAVLALQGVRNGELAELSEQEITGVRRDLQQLRARGHLQALVDSLRQDADVSIREERL